MGRYEPESSRYEWTSTKQPGTFPAIRDQRSSLTSESSIILEDIDRLEISVTTVNFSYSRLERQRALQKLSAAAMQTRLPIRWRMRRHELTPKQFKACLCRQLAPLKLSSKEIGAIIDLFGSRNRNVDTRDFSIFFTELGFIERSRRNIGRAKRMACPLIKKKFSQHRILPHLARKKKRTPSANSSEHDNMSSGGGISSHPRGPSVPGRKETGVRLRRRSSLSILRTQEIYGDSSTLLGWTLNKPPIHSVSDFQAEKDSLRTALVKLCAAASLDDGISRGNHSAMSATCCDLPIRTVKEHIAELYGARLSQNEVSAICKKFACPRKANFVDCRFLHDQYLMMARYGFREPETQHSVKATLKGNSKQLASLAAFSFRDLESNQTLSDEKDVHIAEIMEAVRQSILTSQRYKMGVIPFAERAKKISTIHVVLDALVALKADSHTELLAQELYKRVSEDGSPLAKKWTEFYARRGGNTLRTALLAARCFLFEQTGVSKVVTAVQVVSHWQTTVRKLQLSRQRRQQEKQLNACMILAIVRSWKSLKARSEAQATTIASNTLDATTRSTLGCRIAAWAASRMGARRLASAILDLHRTRDATAALTIQFALREYASRRGYNYPFKLRTLAALILQTIYRNQKYRRSQKRAKHLATELKHLNAVLDIQRWWKRGLCHHHVKQLQYLRSRQKKNSSARRIQLRFRIMMANRILEERRIAQALAIESSAIIVQNKWRSKHQQNRWLVIVRQKRAQTRIASLFRMHLVGRISPLAIRPQTLDRMRELLMYACPLLARVHSATSSHCGSPLLTESPCVYVTAYSKIEPSTDCIESAGATEIKDAHTIGGPRSMAGYTENPTFCDPTMVPRFFRARRGDDNYTSLPIHQRMQVALCKTQPAIRNHSQEFKEWNDEILINGVESSTSLAFTVCSDASSGTDARDFYGQAELALHCAQPDFRHTHGSQVRFGARAETGVWWCSFAPRWRKAKKLRLPLQKLSKQVEIERGRLLRLKNRERSPSGEICVSLRVAPPAYNMCGYVLRRVEFVLTTLSWKPSWVVLARGMLKIFSGRCELNPTHEIETKHILAIDFNIEDEVIGISVAGNGSHKLRIDDPIMRRMWLRKLRRCSTLIPTNEYITEEVSHQSYIKKHKNLQLGNNSRAHHARRRAGIMLVS